MVYLSSDVTRGLEEISEDENIQKVTDNDDIWKDCWN
jgi:hypothetical protein